jgi:hypothetical protein
MRSMRPFLLLLLFCALPAASRADSHWLCATGKHVRVYSCSDRDSVLRIATGLESMADVLDRTGLGSRPPVRPHTTILAFPDHQAFTPNLPVVNGKRADLAGFVLKTPLGSWIGYAEYDFRGRMVVNQQYALAAMGRLSSQIPPALGVGLAEYLSTFKTDADGVEFGHSIRWHRDVVESKPLLSLDELFAIKAGTVTTLHGGDQALFYAESWALVCYLRRGDASGETFFRFAREAADGAPLRAAFERNYPREQWDQVPAALKAFGSAGTAGLHRIPIHSDALAATIAIRPASDAEVASQTGLWRLYAANVDTAGTRALFEAALAREPDLALAQAGLGCFWMRAGKQDEALVLLRRAGSHADAGALALTIAGAGMLAPYSSMDRTTGPALAEEARTLLARSLRADSTDAIALGWFAKASLAAGHTDDTLLAVVRRASDALPEDATLASALSLVLARQGQPDQAREVVSSHGALAREPAVGKATASALGWFALGDSMEAAVDAGHASTAIAMLDHADTRGLGEQARAELAAYRANLVDAAADDSARAEFAAASLAVENSHFAEARAHLLVAKAVAHDPELRLELESTAAGVDSLLADEPAERMLAAALAAFDRGDIRTMRAECDSARTRALDPDLRARAEFGFANASASLEYDHGIEALRRNAWPEAARAFERSRELATTPEGKAKSARMLAETRKLIAGAKH